MLYCDWSVIARLMRRLSLTRSHHATAVGPIRFSNRSNNCRVGKINRRRSSLVRSHHAIFVFSSSNKRRKSHGVSRALAYASSAALQLRHFFTEAIPNQPILSVRFLIYLRIISHCRTQYESLIYYYIYTVLFFKDR